MLFNLSNSTDPSNIIPSSLDIFPYYTLVFCLSITTSYVDSLSFCSLNYTLNSMGVRYLLLCGYSQKPLGVSRTESVLSETAANYWMDGIITSMARHCAVDKEMVMTKQDPGSFGTAVLLEDRY